MLVATGGTGTGGTINYASGVLTIVGGGNQTMTGYLNYYPQLPVMGLQSVILDPTDDTHTMAFDTDYPYDIPITNPYTPYAINFYRNNASGGTYTAKTTWTSFQFNGQDYQQFWTVNYENALFVTNGISRPFSSSNIQMQYKAIVTVTVLTATTATLQITGHGLVVGDFVFVNEVATTTGINFQTGYVTTVTDVNNVIVTFPNATLATNGSGGIAQYLTNNSDPTKDCLKIYNGLPVDNSTPPNFQYNKGWVNYCPPLSNLNVSIAGQASAQYYLVGARIILPFKDRLIFIGPVIQTSSAGSQVYLQDTVIFSKNGTPFYTASFPGTPAQNTTYTPLLTPVVSSVSNIAHTADPRAFWVDQTGLGGWVSAGFATDINTASPNEDVIIMGFGNRQARFVYTGNSLLPFAFYVINSELGSSSTFSAVNLDRGVISVGTRGVILTSQNESKRIDLDIPDQSFKIQLTDQGAPRICSIRDYINEWIYMTYATSSNGASGVSYAFPSQTLLYNYREGTWGIFNECYTTYGIFRARTGYTWSTIGSRYPTWNSWNDPWNAGESNLLQPDVIGGNQQGFIVFKSEGTGESPSLVITSISGTGLPLTITSANHCLNQGDFIVIQGCLGTISVLNGNPFQVGNVTTNTFTIENDLNPVIIPGSYTYLGAGVVVRMYVPEIKTRQFPVSWSMARKTRIGPQQYLLTTTQNGQITLQIFLSQNSDSPYNNEEDNNAVIYSTVLYTCPESTNLGLTPSNINLQMVTAVQQSQTWHRMNTSLIGDTVQIGFTMSEAQMLDPNFNNQFSEIEIHGMVIDVSPSQVLA